MMTRAHDVRLGRVLVMTLHQAIAEELPTRADFYEHWLGPDRWRDAGLGLAPMAAVLGFLRTEGDAYWRVMTRAGRLAGEWTWQATPVWRRQWVQRLPRGWRRRTLARWFAREVAEIYPQTTAVVRVSKDACVFTIRGSVFCGSREVPDAPLCGFYAEMAAALFAAAGMPASGRMETCRAGADKEDTCTGQLTAS
jgi:hypothetical protein